MLRLAEELVENLPIGTYVTSFSPEIPSYVSPAAERLLGYRFTQARDPLEFVESIAHPEDRHRILESTQRLLSGETDSDRAEFRVVHADGSLVWLYGAVDLVRDPAGRPLYMRGFWVDITERKHLEEQLHLSQRMEMIGQLAGGVAHDFNNLLTAIAGYADIALAALDEGHEAARPIERVKEAADRAAELTEQLLAFGRRQVLQPGPLELGDAVERALRLLQRVLGEKIELRTASQQEPVWVLADSNRIEQVIVCLAVNARDAMADGGELWIETGHREVGANSPIAAWGAEPGTYAALVVRDSGCGMDEGTVVHAFEPFFTTKEVGKGSGLGLSTVYGIVKQSGGWITIDSEPDVGTTVTVYLPCREEPSAPAVVASRDDGAAVQVAPRILLVEDEATVRELAGEMLRRDGYEVTEAEGPAEALQLADEQGFDLVVTDVVMPKMNGRELVRRIREDMPGVSVIYMSGYTPESVLDGLGPGERFLQKPFTMGVLTETVGAALGGVAAGT
jgi:two-component system cell cycle sensor histidine kinase/response regulator CckA